MKRTHRTGLMLVLSFTAVCACKSDPDDSAQNNAGTTDTGNSGGVGGAGGAAGLGGSGADSGLNTGGMSASGGTSGGATGGLGGASGGAGGTGDDHDASTGGMSSQDAGGDDAGGNACTVADSSGCIDEVAGSAESDLGFFWKDSWLIMGCPDKSTHDCVTVPSCPNGGAADFEDRGAVTNETFPLGGAMGTTYAVTFKFNAIAEGKYYQGGQFAKADQDVVMTGGADPALNESGINAGSLYIGGHAKATDYNVMRMRVLDSDREEVARYYLNAFPESSGAESHRTFLYAYQHTIDVPGHGFIEYRIQDSNCKAVDNCNSGNVSDDGTCEQARSLPNEPDATLPAMYNDVAASTQPTLVPLADLNPITGAAQPWHAQIGHVTVTRIVPK